MSAQGYEVGPIRPPSEANSLLVRVTRNCPWNKCKFCNLYKGERFGTRSFQEIKADIDNISLIYGENVPASAEKNCQTKTRPKPLTL